MDDFGRTRDADARLRRMRNGLGLSVICASFVENIIRFGTSSGQSKGSNLLLFSVLAVLVYFALKPQILKAVPDSFSSRRRGPWHWVYWPAALCLSLLFQLPYLGQRTSLQVEEASDIRALQASANQTRNAQSEAVTTNSQSAFLSKEFDGISISLPKNWQWMGQADSQSLNTASEAFGDSIGMSINQGNNTILVAGNAFDDAKVSVATIRLSVRPTSTISQADLRQALSESQSEFEREIVGQSDKVAVAMRRSPQIKYVNVIGGGLRQNGALVCSWSGFEYDIGKGATVSDSWVCPLSNRTLKLSTSYAKNRTNLFSPIVDHVWKSLRLQ